MKALRLQLIFKKGKYEFEILFSAMAIAASLLSLAIMTTPVQHGMRIVVSGLVND